jgi:hypothetical protein
MLTDMTPLDMPATTGFSVTFTTEYTFPSVSLDQYNRRWSVVIDVGGRPVKGN